MESLANNHFAVCFAEALAEELVEIKKLRGKRLPISQALTPQKSDDWEEVQRLANRAGENNGSNTDGEKAAADATTVVGEARKMKLAGLAFSGGGIRSATFNLGVLQGLAQFNKVRTFDYLSTVSGGGYIGNWLEAWVQRVGLFQKKKQGKDSAVPEGIHVVEEELRPTRAARQQSVREREQKDQKSHTEPPSIRFLRDYSNYLTPRLGMLGADTWTVIAIYLRNLFLNQSILILFLFALLLIPYIAVWLTHALPASWNYAAPIAVFALTTWALTAGAFNLQNLIGPAQRKARTRAWLPPQEQRWVIVTIVAPVFAAMWILTAWLWPHADVSEQWNTATMIYWWPLGGIALLGLPLLIGSLLAPHQKEAKTMQPTEPHTMLAWLRKCKFGWLCSPKFGWAVASLVTGAVSGLLMYAAFHEAFRAMHAWPGNGADWHELGLGVPLSLAVFLVAAVIQVGLMGRSFYDPYREWWVRVAGWILILTILWAAGFGLAIYAPLGLMWLRGWLKAAGGLAWIASTAAGVWGGKSDKTGKLEAGDTKSRLLSITPYLFIVGLLSLVSLSLELILARIYMAKAGMAAAWGNFLAESPGVEKAVNWMLKVNGNVTAGALTLSGSASTSPGAAGGGAPAYVQAHFALLNGVTSGWLIPVFVLVLFICVLLSYRVDLNEFSMNLMYRNRLVRCYLGASHEERKPNPFSGFDCGDDLLLSNLRSSKSYSGPLPILNSTLNLVSTRDLAWQERKAESFPMTPLRCGFDTWIEQRNLERNYEHDTKMGEAKHTEKYAYRPTGMYGYGNGGFYVGTAMSISGAAASPNMGYHSLPSLAILMTFFNVRLGFWAGNPRNMKTWTSPGPKVGLKQLLSELFGLTNDNAKYVYLSDGGHFENLGVYELVKRRCKYIVACDAGADPNYSFEDLGNAIRKCREDIGVEIEIDTTPLIPKSNGTGADKCDGKKQTTQHCVVGTIHYDMADPAAGKREENGVIIYIKASLTGDEPADVLNYQTGHPTFPHQSTADQWFTESQFESYRRLGQHVVEALFAGPEDEDITSDKSLTVIRELSTEKLFEDLKKTWSGNSRRHRPTPRSK